MKSVCFENRVFIAAFMSSHADTIVPAYLRRGPVSTWLYVKVQVCHKIREPKVSPTLNPYTGIRIHTTNLQKYCNKYILSIDFITFSLHNIQGCV